MEVFAGILHLLSIFGVQKPRCCLHLKELIVKRVDKSNKFDLILKICRRGLVEKNLTHQCVQQLTNTQHFNINFNALSSGSRGLV
jgi:hypothetical protein